MSEGERARAWRRGWVGGLVAAVALALLAAPVLLAGRDAYVEEDGQRRYLTSEAGDAEKYHVPVIETMAAQWPDVDLRNYRSATSPGYHLVMAGAVRAGADGMALRWLNLLAGCALVGIVAGVACARAPTTGAGLLVAAPIVVSPYVVSSSCWVTTDNAALAWVALAVGAAALGEGRSGASVAGGIGALLAVAMRQVHVWTIAPVGLAAAAGSGLLCALPAISAVGRRMGLVHGEPGALRWDRLAVGAAAVVASLALLLVFVWLWGGLMPPAYRDKHASGVSWAAPALSLSLAGIFGTPLLAHAWRAGAWRASDPLVLIGAVGGLLTAVVPATSWDPDTGRMFGWLWEVVRRAPDVGERSLLLALLATVGGAALAILWRGAAENGRARGATILLFAGVCWCTAQMANAQAWQRYMEPPVLAGVIWLAALAMPKSGADSPKLVRAWRVLGPLTLAGWLGIVSVITIYAKVF